MHKNSRPYRDTWAAPGSQLFEALEDGDKVRAERIYRECEERLRLEQLPTMGYRADDPRELMNCDIEMSDRARTMLKELLTTRK